MPPPLWDRKVPEPSRHHQASAAAWPTSWCFVVAAKKGKALLTRPFSAFFPFYQFFRQAAFACLPRWKMCFRVSCVQPSCLALAYNLCWLHLTASEKQVKVCGSVQECALVSLAVALFAFSLCKQFIFTFAASSAPSCALDHQPPPTDHRQPPIAYQPPTALFRHLFSDFPFHSLPVVERRVKCPRDKRNEMFPLQNIPRHSPFALFCPRFSSVFLAFPPKRHECYCMCV